MPVKHEHKLAVTPATAGARMDDDRRARAGRIRCVTGTVRAWIVEGVADGVALALYVLIVVGLVTLALILVPIHAIAERVERH